ncbi:MAG: hypothetical protein ACRD3G_30895 [Vicinamibacterales bacterium]
MPVIKPRTRGKQVVRHITRLDRENNETLYAYAQFLGEPTEYVINQLVESVLAKDKDFVAWRADHPQSFVPQTVSATRKPKRHVAAAHTSRATAHNRESIPAGTAG